MRPFADTGKAVIGIDADAERAAGCRDVDGAGLQQGGNEGGNGGGGQQGNAGNGGGEGGQGGEGGAPTSGALCSRMMMTPMPLMKPDTTG